MSTKELAEFLKAEATMENNIRERMKNMGAPDEKLAEIDRRIAAFNQAAGLLSAINA